MIEPCARCGNSGWVCEAHPDQPWLKADGGSHCGAPGDPCPDCNPTSGRDDPPDDSRVIVTKLADAIKCNGPSVA